MNTVDKVDDLSAGNVWFDVLYPFLMGWVLLEVVGPVILVVELADVAVGHAALFVTR